ncbi:hypothetical protein [Thalassospira marina]|uniref:Uncharacterized protein n=1 Tax=Thalassospira marina TaxID=2048283 RepID=A0A2N3KST9_9PROT|nr:hypothetical protein [Thalassospira marina]PKR53543.1 hypothetical protein COO20_13465 [Thalassospira marina]
MAFEYLVDLEECVSILENFYDLITEDRADWNHEGDIMLPARSVVELSRDDLTPGQSNVAENFDIYARQLPEYFNAFFSLDRARFDPATALDGWLYDQTKKEIARVPQDHWWWKLLEEPGDA